MKIDLSKCRAQQLAHQHLLPEHTVCIPWGRGIGKSWITRLFWYLLVLEWDGKLRPGADSKGVRIVLLMPTLVQAKKVHAQLLVAELDGAWKFLGATVNRTDWRVTFPGGSWIQFVSADVADNSRGIRCDVVFIDECDDVDPEIVESVTAPWFSEPHSLRITVIGGTPRRGRYGLLYRAGWQWPKASWWMQQNEGMELEEAQSLASLHHSFHATAYDAPKLVDPRYLARVRRKTLPTVFAREWLCDPDSAEGLVYPMFNEDLHVREPFLPFHTFLVGIDHGWEDPAVFLLSGISGHGRDALVHVLYEFCKSHQSLFDLAIIAKELAAEHPGARWFADSARPSDIAEYERQAQVKITHATHKIEDGVSVVAAMLAGYPDPRNPSSRNPKLFISPKCHNLIREMGMYRRKRDPKNKELILDDIEDKNNHCLVAGTMVITGRGEIPIERVTTDDVVWTRSGWKRVLFSGLTDLKREVWKLTASNGSAIVGTGNHLIYANDAWIRLDALKYGDILNAWTENESPSMVSTTIDTPNQSTCVTDGISARMVADGCIGQSGNTISVRFQMDATSTTRMMTHSTMSLATSSALQPLNIFPSTARQTQSSLGKECTSSKMPPRPGMAVKRAGNGMQNTPLRYGCLENQTSGIAASAKWSLSPSLTVMDSAQTGASLPFGVNLDSMTWTGNVQPAARYSRSINTAKPSPVPVRVQSLDVLRERADVYDLTVDDAHEFYANGILVHNCQDALRYKIFHVFGGIYSTKAILEDCNPNYYDNLDDD